MRTNVATDATSSHLQIMQPPTASRWVAWQSEYDRDESRHLRDLAAEVGESVIEGGFPAFRD
jgi:hypothetical protein